MSKPQRDQPIMGVSFQGMVPPHNLDAEKAVLGAILLDNEAYYEVIGTSITTEMYYHEAHKILWDGITAIMKAGNVVDELTLSEELGKKGSLEKVGGEEFISDLLGHVVSNQHVKRYSEIVRDKWLARNVIQTGLGMASNAYNETDSNQIIDAADSEIRSLQNLQSNGGRFDRTQFLRGFYKLIDDGAFAKNGLDIGFTCLHQYDFYIDPGSLTILAARPSVGKTTMALNIASNLMRQGKKVLYFSVETSNELNALKMISARTLMPTGRMMYWERENKPLTHDEWIQIQAAGDEMWHNNLELYDEITSTDEIIRMTSKIHRRTPVDIIIIDYIGLLEPPATAKGYGNRTQEVGAITSRFKQFGKKTGIPTLMLAQLNRDMKGRASKRPVLFDLRESGDIEQDADNVLFIYRGIMHCTKPELEPLALQQKADIDIAKRRMGAVGRGTLRFIQEHSLFTDLSDHELWNNWRLAP